MRRFSRREKILKLRDLTCVEAAHAVARQPRSRGRSLRQVAEGLKWRGIRSWTGGD
jgi:hypothetical protein